ncbi:TonB-dependent receptor plug domain-containing protein [Cellvibrio sp. UBA7671]|uniref:TonB-dependent receptor plug domain-containing protein n=1 Tax=Cellvibrio sp. UBA7671 TaxID=1946312 RepID=UPI002F36096D
MNNNKVKNRFKNISHLSMNVLPTALLLNAMPLFAQQNAIEQIIVTGTYNPLTMEQVSSSLSVVDREMLGQLNKTNLAEVLQSIPGVLIERQGGPGGLAVASIRGGESNYTVVMIDGIAMNDPGNSRGGAFDLGSINVDSIERIEIVRGPQSAIYGADALAGVINIITLRPQQGHQQSISASVGDEGFQQAGFSALGAGDKTDYAIQARVRDSGEPVEGSRAEDSEINLRLGWRPTDAHSITASVRYFDGDRSSYPEQSGGPQFATSPALDYTDYTDKSAALGWQFQIAEQWKSHLQATHYERSELFDSPGIAPYNAIPPNGADTEFKRQQISWINTLGEQGKLWANVGLENRKEEGDSRGYLDFGFVIPTDFALDRSTDSGFIDINAQLNEKLLLQASVRNDDTDGFGGETSNRLGLRYQLSESIALRANRGDGYKLPSFFALGHPLVGNANLKPEKVDSWDAGIAWQLSDQLNTSIDYFANDFRDPIDFDSELFTNVNREQIKTSGVEWQAQWSSVDNRVGLRGNVTYTDIDVKDSVSVLTGRPQWRAGIAAHWQLSESLRTSLDYQQVGEQFATSQHTGDATLQVLDDYQRLDATLFWSVSDSLGMTVSVENLFDSAASTAVGFPAPGLLWRFGLQWKTGQQ